MPPQSPATTIKTKSEAMPREHLRDSLFRPEGYPNWAVGVDVSTHSSRSCANLKSEAVEALEMSVPTPVKPTVEAEAIRVN
jgi:hypothetical protein